jgi:hypothetical protein
MAKKKVSVLDTELIANPSARAFGKTTERDFKVLEVRFLRVTNAEHAYET